MSTLHCLVFNIQLNSACILLFVCSENIAICLKQISKTQAGIFSSIRDSEQAAEKQLFKNLQPCFRLRQNERLQGILFTRFYNYLNCNKEKNQICFFEWLCRRNAFQKLQHSRSESLLYTGQFAS